MTTAAAAIPTNGHTPRQTRTIAEQCEEILSALIPPKLRDLRERTAKAAKAAGASQAVVEAILAVPLEAPATWKGSAE